MDLICKQCNKAFSKFRQKDQTNYFCSRSCWATYSNLHDKQKYSNRKKSKEHNCKYCSQKINGRKAYCEKCKEKIENGDFPISEIIYIEHHKSSAYAFIRTRARAIAKKLGWKQCCKCGYNKHIQIAHKRQVASFSEDTLLNVVNHPDNLMPLCPNCHWEFDHPEKDKEQIKIPKVVLEANSKAVHQSIPIINKICPSCGGNKLHLSKMCRKCSNLERRGKNSKCPTKEQLELDFIQLKSFVKIGNKYQVSDNAVRKWCIQLGLPHTRFK